MTTTLLLTGWLVMAAAMALVWYAQRILATPALSTSPGPSGLPSWVCSSPRSPRASRPAGSWSA